MNTKSLNVKDILSKLGPLLALVLIVIILTISTEGRLVGFDNIMNIFRQASINSLVAAGMLVVILTGGIDLSVGSLLAVSISTMGVAMKTFGIENPVLLIIICLATGTLFGLANGLLLTKLHLPHPFISTLGTKNIARGIGLWITGAAAIAGFPDAILFPGSADVGGFPVSFIIVIITFVIFHIFLTQTGLGRKIYSIGGNIEAARLAGVNTDKVLTFCYALSGFMAAFGGIIYVGRLNSAVPLASLEGDLDAIASCIIGGASFNGGKGSIWGTLIGSMVITVIRNGLDIMGVQSDVQQIVIGAVIVIAVFTDVVRTRMEARAKKMAMASKAS